MSADQLLKIESNARTVLAGDETRLNEALLAEAVLELVSRLRTVSGNEEETGC